VLASTTIAHNTSNRTTAIYTHRATHATSIRNPERPGTNRCFEVQLPEVVLERL
jgi:hypothetical protein